MFKSKYGLIGVVLVLVFTLVSAFWVKSSVSKKVNNAAMEQLNRGDFLLRQLEKGNEGNTVSLTTKGSMLISEKFVRFTKLQDKLNAIMDGQLMQMAGEIEVPSYLAVVGNAQGVKQHKQIHWLAVNGTVVTEKVKDEWLTNELLASLKKTPARKFSGVVKITKAAPKKKVKKSSKVKKAKKVVAAKKSNSSIKIPLFPGEKHGAYYVKPQIYKQLPMEGVQLPLGVKIVKSFKKVNATTYKPVFEGVLIVGFKSNDLNLAKQVILKHSRGQELVKIVYELNKLKKEMFTIATALYNSSEYQIKGMKPHISVLTNTKGIVITRDKDDSKLSGFNYLKNSVGSLSMVAKAVKTKSVVYDVLTYEVINRYPKKTPPASLYQAATIPILGMHGKVVGTFTMAWAFDVRLAQLKTSSNLEFAFFYGKNVFYPSFTATNKIKEINDAFKGRLSNVKTSPYVLGNGSNKKGMLIKGEVFKIGGGEYLGSVFKYQSGTLAGENYGYMVLVSTSKISKPFSGVFPLIMGLGIFVIILIMVLENLVFFYFYKAIDSLDEGVQEVAAGDMDFMFGRVSKETEGLSNSLNEMLNVIFGRETLDEESGEAPVKEGIHILSLGKVPEMVYLGDDPKVVEIIELSDSDFENRLYSEFVSSWEELGEEDAVPSRDLFNQRMKLYERMVLRQLECGRVLFSIAVTDDGIEVSPLPVA
jgi:HAMP domain-containing protein